MTRTYNGRFYSPEEPKPGTGWLVAGLLLIPTWPSILMMVVSIACFVKYGKRASERKLYKRFHDFCSVIGMRGRVPLNELRSASPAGTGTSEVREMLQKMISRGYFGSSAYIDMTRGELVLPDVPEGRSGGEVREKTWKDLIADALDLLRGERIFQSDAQEEELAVRPQPQPQRPQPQPPKPQPAPEPEPEPVRPRPAKPQKRTYAEELEQTLGKLYQLNEQIADEGVSRRIDRIGTLTAGIFRAVIEKPEREQDVRKFMNYYLPTTLKLLHSYDMLEEQDYQSESIVESRRKIEEILDALIKAYEKQLDRLFRDDALDIATDIDVLETMMAGDGLL